MLSRSDAVPRHNGAPIGMRLTLRHDSHGLATVVPALSSLLAPPPKRAPGWRGPFIPSRWLDRSPRMKADPFVARLRFDRFELDEAEARLRCAGEPVALAPKPFA